MNRIVNNELRINKYLRQIATALAEQPINFRGRQITINGKKAPLGEKVEEAWYQSMVGGKSEVQNITTLH